MRARTRFLALPAPEGALSALLDRLEAHGLVCLRDLDPAGLHDVLAAGDTDVVLVDAARPRSLDRAKALKAAPGMRHIPVVAVTDLHADKVAAHALAIGADDVLVMPMRDAALFARLRALVGLATADLEVLRRREILARFAEDAGAPFGGFEQAPAGILLVGSACAEQLQVVSALGGRVSAVYAENPVRAREQLHRRELDAVVLSGHIHEDQAEALCRMVRTDAASFDLPILVTMPNDPRIDPDRAFAWGASDVLQAPLHPEILRLRVQGWLRQRRLRRCLRASFDGSSRLGISDQPSGLYGHGFVHAYLDDLIASNAITRTPLAVAAFDLRGMRAVNRRHGFPVGDRLLAHVGATIARQSRAEDLPARVCGNRFVVVFNAIGAEQAAATGERIAATVARTPLALPGGSALTVTIDWAVTEALPGDGAQSLIERALAGLRAASLRAVS